MDLFKEMQKIHNNTDINNRNNFITGISTFLDDTNVKNELVSIRLLPHQIFIFPRAYILKLTNRLELQANGIEYYKSSELK